MQFLELGPERDKIIIFFVFICTLQVQIVTRRFKFSLPYKESEPNPFGKTYRDGVGKEFHLVYALPNFDTFHRLISANCYGCPLLFVLCMSYYYYSTYKDLEYTANDLHEVLEHLEEIFMNIPHSANWLIFLAFLAVCGRVVHYCVVRNNIGRLYYNSKQDQYTGIVFKYGRKERLKFSRSEVVRNPAFFEKYFAKTGINIGKKTRYFIFEGFFKDNHRNYFFSDVASPKYLEELGKKHGYR